MNAAGRLPETAPGFHQDLPGAAFGKLGGAKNSYQKFQLIDIPYALLNTIFALTSIGLGLKTLNLALSAGRFLLFVPLIYLGAEAIENTLLLAMSATLIDISHRAVFIQQAATTIKFIAIGPALTLSILAISIAAVRALRR